ncbi:Uncharacterized protein SCF082_LOCUS51089 [Durusdinium trenchii]|uniref:Uncharacterized protein n=1 Tax=Durusdinium trenchii TaxID=1381693 RepID=A0ABP0SC97_9DINO
MTDAKQHVFLQRVLFIFDVTKRSAGKAQVLRLSAQQWAAECDLCCLGAYVLEQMHDHRDANNLMVFNDGVVKTVMNQLIEGDFHEELKQIMEVQDAAFKPEMCSMWSDHLPSAAAAPSDAQLVHADEKIEDLTKQNWKLQFEADSLSLARDAAQLARLYSEETKSERASRVARVCHLRQENAIGSSLAASFMAKSCHHRAGSSSEIQEELSKDLNLTMDCIQKALACMPERSVAFAIGSLSDVQETAQLLSGESMPNAVLTSLLSGSETDSLIGVVNLTPYDGNLEISLLKRGLAKPEHTYRSLSFANDMTVSQHCEKVCAFHLFEDIMWMNIDWKVGGKLMGDVRAYDPSPPKDASGPLDISSFPLKLAQLSMDPKQKGIAKFKVELTNEVRMLHLDNVLYGPSWRSLIQDFDKKFCGGAATTDSTVVAAPEVEEEPAPTPFTLEPDTVDRLLEMYVVENKVPAREPGCMLMLTSAVRRDGTKVEMIEGQKMKLWLVAHHEIEIADDEFQLAHGKSTWLKPEKVQKLMREGGGLVCLGLL